LASIAPEAEIIAIEKIRIRFYKLLANLKIQGVNNVKALLLDGIWVRKRYPEYFDKILVDAPCSAEGRFYIKNPRTFKYWKDKKIKEMVNKQKKLLSAAFYALNKDRVLVYSTCTFSPEENEGMVDWLLNKFKDAIEILPVEVPLSNVRNGLTNWESKKFSASLKLTKRIVPNSYMEGFFIAKIKKTSF